MPTRSLVITFLCAACSLRTAVSQSPAPEPRTLNGAEAALRAILTVQRPGNLLAGARKLRKDEKQLAMSERQCIGNGGNCRIADGKMRMKIDASRFTRDSTEGPDVAPGDSVFVLLTTYQNHKNKQDGTESFGVSKTAWTFHYIKGKWVRGELIFSQG